MTTLDGSFLKTRPIYASSGWNRFRTYNSKGYGLKVFQLLVVSLERWLVPTLSVSSRTCLHTPLLLTTQLAIQVCLVVYVAPALTQGLCRIRKWTIMSAMSNFYCRSRHLFSMQQMGWLWGWARVLVWMESGTRKTSRQVVLRGHQVMKSVSYAIPVQSLFVLLTFWIRAFRYTVISFNSPP